MKRWSVAVFLAAAAWVLLSASAAWAARTWYDEPGMVGDPGIDGVPEQGLVRINEEVSLQCDMVEDDEGAAVYKLEDFDIRTRYTKADSGGLSYRYRFRGTAWVHGRYLSTPCNGNPRICIKKGEQIWYTCADSAHQCSNDWIHYPYHWGAKGPDTCPTDYHEPYDNDNKQDGQGKYLCCFDCSGFAGHMYSRCGINITYDTAQDQYNDPNLTHIEPGEELRGDLIFWWSESRQKIGHVAVSEGGDVKAHASSRAGWTCVAPRGNPGYAAGKSADGWCMTSACSH